MKRIFALILALCMTFSLFACGKKQTEVAPGGDSPTVTPGATDPGSGPAENPGGSAGVPGGAGSTGNAGNGGNTTGSTGSGWAGTRVAVIYFSCTGNTRTAAERIPRPDRGGSDRAGAGAALYQPGSGLQRRELPGQSGAKGPRGPAPDRGPSRWTCPSMAPSIWAIPSGRAPHHGSSTHSWTAMT